MALQKIITITIFLFLFTAATPAQEPGKFSSSGRSKQETSTAEEHYLGYEALAEAARSIAAVIESQGRAGNTAPLIVCGKSECRNLVRLRLLYELFESGSDRIIAESGDAELQSALANIIRKLSSGEPKVMSSDSRSPTPAGIVSTPTKIIETLEAWTGVIGQANSTITEAAKLINSLTKTDVTVTSSVIDATNSHLSTALVRQLVSPGGIRVYLPEYEQMENVNVQESKAYTNYGKLRVIVDKGESRLAQIKYLREVSQAASSLTPDELDQIERMQGLVRDAKEILTITVAESLGEDDDGETPEKTAFVLDLKALEKLIKAERFSTELRNGAMILSVDIIKVIGTRIEKKNLILGIRNRFSGSATVQYVLTDNKGNLLFADTAIVHTGSRKLSNIRKAARVP